MARKSTRRDFLRGKAPPEPPARIPGSPLPESRPAASPGTSPAGAPPDAATPESYLLHVSRPAMACRFELLFNAGQYANDTTAALEALDLVQLLEDGISYFRTTSQLSRVNALAAEMPVEVEPPLFDLLRLSLELHAQTAGALDVAAAPLWEAWGFSRRAGRIPSDEEIAEALERTGSHLIELDPGRRTVRFKRAGVRINLGSIGKGYALDRAGEVLAAAGVADFLFHGGQSSVLARGSRLEPAGGRPSPASPGWSVGVRHPLWPRRRVAEIRLRNRALGTSGSTMQFFRHRGRRYAHILDPKTGRPADGVLSATVVAPSAAVADALSTAFFVMGPEQALAFCRTRPEIAAILICPGTHRGRHEIHTAGFQRGELSLF